MRHEQIAQARANEGSPSTERRTPGNIEGTAHVPLALLEVIRREVRDAMVVDGKAQ
jgi:hypothetical protein